MLVDVIGVQVGISLRRGGQPFSIDSKPSTASGTMFGVAKGSIQDEDRIRSSVVVLVLELVASIKGVNHGKGELVGR